MSALEYIDNPEGCSTAEPVLFPNGVFMGGLAAIALVALLMGRSMAPSQWQAVGLGFAIFLLSYVYMLWEYRGHAIRWDEEAIYIRRPHPILCRRRRTSFARIPYSRIDSIVKFAPGTRVPRRLASVEILLKGKYSAVEGQFVIETNLFRRKSLITLLDNLQKRVPQLATNGRGNDLKSLMQDLKLTQTPQ